MNFKSVFNIANTARKIAIMMTVLAMEITTIMKIR